MDTILAIDFDGTVVTHEFSYIGDPVPGALKWLKKFQDAGALLILWTVRSKEDVLGEAVDYLQHHGIRLWGVNENPEQKGFNSSPKAYAAMYIDDRNAGCPLVRKKGHRPYVDWEKIGPLAMDLIEKNKKKY